MRRGYESHKNSSYYALDSGSYMDDYLSRITAMQRSPTMIPDYPNFPSVHEIMHHDSSMYAEKQQKKGHHKHQVPQGHKKVHFFEHDEANKIDKGRKHKLHEEKTIDSEADGFIQQRHKNFELYKWDTFRA